MRSAKFVMKGSAGFSLVELMIVVAIIGTLAALAVPRFQNFQAKAKQSEAKNNLSHIYTLEQSYYGDYDTFSDTTNIGFVVDGSRVRYAYTAVSGGATFVGTAAAPGAIILSNCAQPDTWTINESKIMKATYDCVTGNAHGI